MSAEERLFKLSYPEPFTEGNTAHKQTLLSELDLFCVWSLLHRILSYIVGFAVIRRLFKLWSLLEPLPINRLHRRLEFCSVEAEGSRLPGEFTSGSEAFCLEIGD